MRESNKIRCFLVCIRVVVAFLLWWIRFRSRLSKFTVFMYGGRKVIVYASYTLNEFHDIHTQTQTQTPYKLISMRFVTVDRLHSVIKCFLVSKWMKIKQWFECMLIELQQAEQFENTCKDTRKKNVCAHDDDPRHSTYEHNTVFAHASQRSNYSFVENPSKTHIANDSQLIVIHPTSSVVIGDVSHISIDPDVDENKQTPTIVFFFVLLLFVYTVYSLLQWNWLLIMWFFFVHVKNNQIFFWLQYSSIDTSPLSVNVMHPFWNYLVQVYEPFLSLQDTQ